MVISGLCTVAPLLCHLLLGRWSLKTMVRPIYFNGLVDVLSIREVTSYQILGERYHRYALRTNQVAPFRGTLFTRSSQHLPCFGLIPFLSLTFKNKLRHTLVVCLLKIRLFSSIQKWEAGLSSQLPPYHQPYSQIKRYPSSPYKRD